MKDMVVAISKSELLDDELKQEIKSEMKGLDLVFFSSVTQFGIVELKDKLWNAINGSL
jgi:GTP-binding protein